MTTVLISGASVAGPTLAYWLHKYGFHTTVLERTQELRAGYGGHAVDLFGPAVEIASKMRVLPRVQAARTMTERLFFDREGKRPLEVDLKRIVAGISDQHVEIMRGELATILHDATKNDVEYVFGDSIATLDDTANGVHVTFEHSSARRTFDLVIGADGLHSNVRRLTFGPENDYRTFLGGYLAAFTVPNYLDLQGEMRAYNTPGKLAGLYGVRQTGEARAAFIFLRDDELDYDYRDTEQQKRLVQREYANVGWEIPRLLQELEHADDFYLDSISQIVMDTWSRGRVTLVGDAGYSPAPAVGGGTSIAMVGAYVLAGELRQANGDHTTAFPEYEQAMRQIVTRFRTVGPTTMKTIVPRTKAQIATTAAMLRVVPKLPISLQRTLSNFQGGVAKAIESITLRDYEPATPAVPGFPVTLQRNTGSPE
ncbi:FAD-dependent monooxygenase [Tenggerimyces flavus]|uniref:FAD-dependent monooxygenase n=1 Tax=Tenggerimyces flavus TaxID=1708749 RepID=A0ABV7Y4S7_9ACTN|nr:FAD-dependent monooxygenase [Tenggerimyces flavus]MBM7790895.1 2-polyprenyl-6-methoxyphenol hydroxylase-like FAD-dependent oxidoreductase [Tenggerimyces flavus]